MNLSFSFVFIFVVVPTIALVTAIYSLIKRKRLEENLFRNGLIYLKRLRKLLMYIQQHRGLTNGFLNGNLSSANDIHNLEGAVAAEIAELNDIDGWVKDNTKWANITDHWFRINSYYQTLEPDVNLKQHNTLIANLLYFIDDLAYEHHLGTLGLIDSAATDWRTLLFVAEYIGQARALGMGAVSKGSCSSVLRIQLNHLVVKIKANINPAWPESTQQDFFSLVRVIEQQVIIDKPSILPADYFKLATGCIEHVLLEFDRQIEKIQFHRT